MGSDHDFLAKNAGFFGVVRKLLPKNAGFFTFGQDGGAKSPVARAFLESPDRPATPAGRARPVRSRVAVGVRRRAAHAFAA